MASIVDIVNHAFDLLGEPPTISLEEDTRSAVSAAKRAWPIVRSEVFQSHPWNELTRRSSLPRLLEAPAYAYQYQYQLPSDHLKTLELYGDSGQVTEYQIEGDRVLTDAESLYIRYVIDTEDASNFSPQLVNVLSHKLALALAETITQSNVKRSTLTQQYKEALDMAYRFEVQENPPIADPWDSWVAARSRYYG